ncbi:MAG: ABC transporter permease [Faecalibacterium sp.]
MKKSNLVKQQVQEDKVVVFPHVAEGTSAKRQAPAREGAIASIQRHFNNFWRYRYLLENLVMRDFKLRYRRSVLGVAWSVLNPLLMCLVYWVVFCSLLPGMRGDGIENFAVFLLCGQLLFGFFGESTNNSMNSMLGAAPLLKKVYIPKYIFPLEKCCFGMVNTFFSFIALLLVMLFTGNAIRWTVVLAIYPLITLFFFTLGVSLALAAFTVFFRDVMHMWTVFTTALMYFSAIFYDPTQMSALFGGFSLQTLILFNPIYWYITAFRTTVMSGEVLTFSMVWVCGLCAVISMVVGSVIFNKTQDKFVLHI